MSEQQISRRVNTDGSTTITLKGSLGIESAGELCQLLNEAIEESPQLIMNLQDLESVDLTILQVICSACKTASAMGRSYDSELNRMPECVSAIGKHLGAPQGLPCGQNSNKPCIWYGGIK